MSRRELEPDSTILWYRWGWLSVVILAAIDEYCYRHTLGQDGLTYLDMARESLSRGPGALIQAMWNPLYPGFLSAWLAVFKPSPRQEIPLIHLADFCLFAVVAACFGLFLRACEQQQRRAPRVWSRIQTLFGLAVFAWIFIGAERLVGPDLMIAASVFLAAWCCVRMAESASWIFPVLLGLALAVGYYAKPAGIPVAVLLLGVLLVFPPGRASRKQILIAAVVFSLSIFPLMVAISRTVGRPTTSDSGKLNYVWHVNKYFPFYGWTGPGDSEHGTPLHPPRILAKRPLTIEFAAPIAGTYPLWFDPSYWYAGVRAQVNLRQEALTTIDSLANLYGTAATNPCLWAGLLAILILIWRQKTRFDISSSDFWILIWPTTVVGVFSLVHVEPRYILSFEVVLTIGAFSLLTRVADRAASGVLLVLTIFMSMMVLTSASFSVIHDIRDLRTRQVDFDQAVADHLTANHLGGGDRIATVGYSFDAYWAHIACLHIAAQVPDERQFWGMDEQELESLVDRLKRLNIKAIVARGGPLAPGGRWQELPVRSGEPYRLLLLN